MIEEIKQQMNEQKIISGKNPIFNHLVENQKWYLLLLLVIVLAIPLVTNYSMGKPIIMGEESYYHLSQAKDAGALEFYYAPLSLAMQIIPESFLFIIPVGLAIFSLLLFIAIIKKTTISNKLSFFFLFILFISPPFIFTFTTISAYSVYFFLVILGFFMLSRKNVNWHYASVIPFVFATFFDLYSGIILVLIQVTNFYLVKKENSSKHYIIWVSTAIFSLINFLILKIPFILGPFHFEQKIPDLISDLGGLSGINFFTIMLAFLGLFITWKRKNFYIFYLFLPLVILVYFFNTQTIFHLMILTVFFAATGFVKIFQRDWNLVALKKFTFFLLILGLIFSTLTYLERIPEIGPSHSDFETLTWSKNNLEIQGKVLSIPENSYFIEYFSEQKPLSQLQIKGSENLTQKALEAPYIDELFPILEQNEVTVIYINQHMKQELPDEQGILFLLKNERFKIVHSHKNSEVWLFVAEENS
jgi:hypothetical protein